ncbi:hypothetical protein, partial [Micromonospora sp. NPDC003776]
KRTCHIPRDQDATGPEPPVDFTVNLLQTRDTRNLCRVAGADPAHRLDVSLGTSARRPVWWSMSDGELTLTVGQDVESGDFVVVLPAALLSEIRAQLDALDADDWG